MTAKPRNVEKAPEKAHLNLSEFAEKAHLNLSEFDDERNRPPSLSPEQPPALSRIGDEVTDEALRQYVEDLQVPPGTRVAFTVDEDGRLTGGEEWFEYGEELPNEAAGWYWEYADVDDNGWVTTSLAPNFTLPPFKTPEERRSELIANVNAATATLSTTDAEERAAGLDPILSGLRFSIIGTDQLYNHKFPPAGSSSRWTPEREAEHEAMWADLLSQVEGAQIPQDKDALVLGGLPGSGKTTTLHSPLVQERFGVTAWEPPAPATAGATHVSINPDAVKEMMIAREMLPPGITGLKPREQVNFIHEESNYLAKKFAQRLSDQGYNIVLDGTMRDTPEQLNRMSPLAHNGYNFRGLFIDIPIDESAESARRRYLEQALTPLGGRFVPSSVVGNRESSAGNLSKNRDTFDQLVGQDWFTDYLAIDNTGISERQPRGEVVAEGTGTGTAVQRLVSPPQFAAPRPQTADQNREIPGVGNVDEYLAANPQREGEAYFEWQSRIVDGLPPDSKHALLFETRERYEPVSFIAEAMTRWRAEHGRPEPAVDLSEIPAPREKADLVARTFEQAEDQADDPRVQAAFTEFKRQSAEMWDFMTRPESEGGMGVTVEFWTNPDPTQFGVGPYADATEQAEDLRNNRRIKIESGLGGAHELTMTTEEYDRFRAVHDVFGHAGIGNGFDRHGEYQAYLAHSSMYDGDGRRAMASEYHGVNAAMWSGEPGTPGTGKSILLPEELIPDPFGPTGEIIAASAALEMPDEAQLAALNIDEATAEALAYLAEQANIVPPFGQWYDDAPFHETMPPEGTEPW